MDKQTVNTSRGFFVTALLLFSPSQFAAADAEVVDLGSDLVKPNSMSNSGVVLGGPYKFTREGGVEWVAPPAHEQSPTVMELTDQGESIGFSLASDSGSSTCPYRAVSFHDGEIVQPFSANSFNELAGSCGRVCTVPGYGTWESTACAEIGGHIEHLYFEADPRARRDAAVAINDSRQVAGYALRQLEGRTALRAFLFDPRTGLEDLGTLGGYSSRAFGLNDLGQVVGSAEVDTAAFPHFRGFLFDRGAGLRDLGTLGGNSVALAINNSGTVVGYSELSGSKNIHAFVYQEGDGLYDLNLLLPPQSDWELLSATAINDSGTIVGMGKRNGQVRGFLLERGNDSLRGFSTPNRLPRRAKLKLVGGCKRELTEKNRIKKHSTCDLRIAFLDSENRELPRVAYRLERSSKHRGPWRQSSSGVTTRSGRANRKVKLSKSSYLRATVANGAVPSRTLRIAVK